MPCKTTPNHAIPCRVFCDKHEIIYAILRCCVLFLPCRLSCIRIVAYYNSHENVQILYCIQEKNRPPGILQEVRSLMMF